MRAVAGAAVVALLVGALAGLPSGVTATAADPAATQPVDRLTDASAAEVDLARPARGATALRMLGDQVDDAARLNGLTTPELTALLREDATAWLGQDGYVEYHEPAAPGAGAELEDDETRATPYPLEDTFELHSNPGSPHTLFLDVDGATVAGTGWNADRPQLPTALPAWDRDGDGAVFNDAERAAVQRVWELVAEDYAPFDVDVTTADPGPDAIRRAGPEDPTYGAHVLVTPSPAARTAVCGGCGGLAYIGTFATVQEPSASGYGARQPAWVFPQALGQSSKAVAETVSHEVGHQLGLTHDGHLADDYYAGHGAWAPIMGTGFDRPVTQWSQGTYAGATNTQDDVAIIASVLGLRPDEAPGTVAGAPETPAGPARIGARGDVDTFLLGTCTGPIELAARPLLGAGGDLDLEVRLLDDTGAPVEVADPPVAMVDPERADGLAAGLGLADANGTYFAAVDGAGADGVYDDYGSLGAYRLTVAGDCALTGRPRLPGALAVASATTDSVSLEWAAPADPGDSPVEHYVLSRSDGGDAVTLPATTTSYTWTGLSPGSSYTFTVAAANAGGVGAAAALVAATAVGVPGAVTDLSLTWNAAEARAELTWRQPESDGGSAVTRYDVFLGGAKVLELASLGPAVYGVTYASPPPGPLTFGVAAVTSAGSGPRADAALTVPGTVATTTSLQAGASGSTVTLTSTVSGGTPTGQVRFLEGATTVATVPVTASSATAVLAGVAAGTHAYRAFFEPDASHLAASSSPVRAVTVSAPGGPGSIPTATPTPPTAPVGPTSSVVASRTTLVAPRRARPGTRPSVRVTVARAGAGATGSVVVRAGRHTVTLALRDGKASYRLPRLRAGTLRVSATYGGDAATSGSRATRTITVARPGR